MTKQTTRRMGTLVKLLAIGLSLAGCGDRASTAAVAATGSTTSTIPTSTTSTAVVATIAGAAGGGTIVNTWSPAAVDPRKLPIGDAKVSTKSPAIGGLWACRAGNPNAGGASADGPWLDVAAGTWDATTKLAVRGSVSWEAAKYGEVVTDGKRLLTTNNLPVGDKTGTFPIATNDPTYAFDRNPGTITERALTISIPATGAVAATPTCLSEGPVGILKNGVFIFNSLDGRGQDAVAHESQDLCDGHPAMTTYHYHNVPSCVRNATAGPSTVVGWVSDGFPIVVERDTAGAFPTNSDLDQCHGRTSPVLIDDKVVTTYHYSVALEFPYFIGCYQGTPTTIAR